MNFLVTGDWQAEFANLDTCEQVVEETLGICEKYKVKHVIHVGDFKEHYNPVDVRVTNFGVNTCIRYRRAGIEFHVLLGNHDRVGMYTDKQNWLPVLQSAGAHTYDEAGGYIVDHEDARKKIWLHFIPFCSSPRKFREYALKLKKRLKGVNEDYALLFFHQDLLGARYNVLAKSKESPLTVKDLHPDKYLFCVGGHIEYMQQLREQWNVWYVGAPFAYDWGAANQRKGYLLINTEDKSIKPIWSKIPRMYDMSWPNFDESRPKNWKGAMVRVHVPCDKSDDVSRLITQVETKYEARFKGARVLAVPEFKDEDKTASKINFEDSDADKVKQFVADTIPTELENDEERICEYVIHQLNKVNKITRAAPELTFLRARAKNFLSFKHVEVEYNGGLVLVSGVNRDWGGRSIGSGKTSLLQLIAVALEGRTFKNQKHNRWARRNSTKQAYVELDVRLADGRECTIHRSRRPHKLKLRINGKDKSSGNRRGTTQELIENTLGITWQSLSNAIYIDQQQVNELLTGTDGARKEILERIQNLERFAKAQDQVKLDIKTTEEFIETLTSNRQILEDRIEVEEQHVDKEIKRELHQAQEHTEKLRSKRSKLKKLVANDYSETIRKARELAEKYNSKHIRVKERLRVDYDLKKRLKSLGPKCTMCLQAVDEYTIQHQIRIIDERIVENSEKLAEVSEKMTAADDVFNGFMELDFALRDNRTKMAEYNVEYKNCLLEQARLTEERRKAQHRQSKVIELCRKLKAVKSSLRSARHDLVFLAYCSELLSKYGLPAELNVQMCPILNKAAKYYSDLFTGGEIKIKFEVLDGEFKVNVMNLHGGETTADQSRGELRLASVLTCFALRDTMKCNLLILDEPGDGLDDVSASKFGRGVAKLVSKFGTVMLATHNPYIVGSVKPDKNITVIKTNGISRIQHNPSPAP